MRVRLWSAKTQQSSWLLLYKQYDDQHKAAALKQYIKWCLTEGQAFNEALGYIRLAPQVIARTTAALDSIREVW
jgi:phosphate transport system substrate-binding protein